MMLSMLHRGQLIPVPSVEKAEQWLAHDPKEFKRVASARGLYHWNADANQEY